MGKTTLTINLGAALTSLGQRVLLIDLDPQGHLTEGVGLQELYLAGEATLYNALLSDEDGRRHSWLEKLIHRQDDRERMARDIVVRLRDDIDGSDAAETVRFAYRGREYEIELGGVRSPV